MYKPELLNYIQIIDKTYWKRSTYESYKTIQNDSIFIIAPEIFSKQYFYSTKTISYIIKLPHDQYYHQQKTFTRWLTKNPNMFDENNWNNWTKLSQT